MISTPKTLTTWQELIKLIPSEFANGILEQFQAGDHDWVIDISREHNEGIQPTSPFYIKEFHSYIPHYITIDTDSLYNSILNLK